MKLKIKKRKTNVHDLEWKDLTLGQLLLIQDALNQNATIGYQSEDLNQTFNKSMKKLMKKGG